MDRSGVWVVAVWFQAGRSAALRRLTHEERLTDAQSDPQLVLPRLGD